MNFASSPLNAVYGAWIAWFVSWMVASVWSSRSVTRVGLSWRSVYRVAEIAGFMLLVAVVVPGRDLVPRGDRFVALVAPLWTMPVDVAWLLAGLTVLGFLFAWWARIYLGSLWSSTVTRKSGHRVVDTGPYALVRHPIYTGILFAAASTAIVRGTPAAILGALLLLLAFWLKARIEEDFLRRELGAEAYDAYARKTAMLMPFVRI